MNRVNFLRVILYNPFLDRIGLWCSVDIVRIKLALIQIELLAFSVLTQFNDPGLVDFGFRKVIQRGKCARQRG